MATNARTPRGFQQLTVSTTAVALPSVPSTPGQAADLAVISLNATNGLRWRDDGTNPTSSVGMLAAGGSTFEYRGSLSALRLIREGAADAVANIAYYQEG
jgi:hypothetical protein